jgi:Ca2+-binding EF-hand superfamily protein
VVFAEELEAAAAERSDDMFDDLFEKYDDNDNGTITSAEILAVVELEAQKVVDDLLDRLDKNDDGELTEEEVTKMTKPKGSGWGWGRFRR